jgi:hypothetical protein
MSAIGVVLIHFVHLSEAENGDDALSEPPTWLYTLSRRVAEGRWFDPEVPSCLASSAGPSHDLRSLC